ncbi:MAG: O-antigen ligase family protein [Prevotellaceae bacterium]|nr:O-antigen ligase family protein [Prevotellaceae bacterium]
MTKNIPPSSYIFPAILCLVVIVFAQTAPDALCRWLFQAADAYPVMHTVLLVLFICLPLLWLVFSKEWKSADIPTRVLLVGTAIYLVSTAYDILYSRNGTILFLCCVGIFFLYKRKVYKPTLLIYLFIAYFVLHAVSLLWADDVPFGLNILTRYLPILTSVAFCFFRLEREHIRRMMLVFFRAMELFIFISLLFWVCANVVLEFNLTDWFVFKKTTLNGAVSYATIYTWTNYLHPTFNAFSCMIAVGFGFFLFGDRKSNITVTWLDLLLIAFGALLLALVTQSRTGFVQIIAVCLSGSVWLLRKHRNIQIAATIVLFIGAVASGILLHDKIALFLNDHTREQLHVTALHAIQERPLLGTGIGGMYAVLESDAIAGELGYEHALKKGLGNPHHQFIGDWMQTGIAGFLLIVWLTLLLFWEAIKRKNFPLFIFLIALFPLMQIEMPFNVLKSTLLVIPFIHLLVQFGMDDTTSIGLRKKR